MATALLNILVFPGFLFLVGFALGGEWLDRVLYARMQNRVGPPWFQPLADIIKLASKEDTIPEGADRSIFKMMPAGAMCQGASPLRKLLRKGYGPAGRK